jgi:hypothetical protein
MKSIATAWSPCIAFAFSRGSIIGLVSAKDGKVGEECGYRTIDVDSPD